MVLRMFIGVDTYVRLEKKSDSFRKSKFGTEFNKLGKLSGSGA